MNNLINKVRICNYVQVLCLTVHPDCSLSDVSHGMLLIPGLMFLFAFLLCQQSRFDKYSMRMILNSSLFLVLLRRIWP